VREGDHRDVAGPKRTKLRKLAWALEASIVTMARAPGAVPTHPNLVMGACQTAIATSSASCSRRVVSGICWRACDAAAALRAFIR
jgi:hypothetical protein